jgi:hypothetical protein
MEPLFRMTGNMSETAMTDEAMKLGLLMEAGRVSSGWRRIRVISMSS